MAKRRLDPPSAEKLAALDAEFRSETPTRPNPATAPIAQVASETAQASRAETPDAQLNRIDAQRMRDAQDKGLIIAELPLDQITADAMVRDRAGLDPDEMAELEHSISTSGLRLPIEVFAQGDGYGLLSGYRRLMAVRALAGRAGVGDATIKAIVRPATDTPTAFAAMVEENEIRSNLSHFERGRIAVIAAQQGAFGSTEEAVNVLFSAGSKSKRSKIRSFAEIFEMLGDMLNHAEGLTERRGLRVASALRQGAEVDLRQALTAGQGGSADYEWAVMEPVIEAVEQGPQPVTKKGRPKADNKTPWPGKESLRLSSGMTLEKDRDGQGYLIRLKGADVADRDVEAAMSTLQKLFEKR